VAPLKLHESSGPGPSADVNGSGPYIDDDEREDDDSYGEDEEERELKDFSKLFDAPSYSEFIKTKPNSRAQTYEKRVASMMKAGLVMSLNNHQWPDAATFLKHGPGFAKAAGNLAAEDARAAAIVDMLTAPESPYVMFALVAMPFVGQLFRNHQQEAEKAATTWRERRADRKAAKREGVKPNRSSRVITVRLFRREIKIPIRFTVKLPSLKAIFAPFLAPTQYPDEITAEVFNDVSVLKALHKMGIYPRAESDEQDAA
jgi:hypothetical protein